MFYSGNGVKQDETQDPRLAAQLHGEETWLRISSLWFSLSRRVPLIAQVKLTVVSTERSPSELSVGEGTGRRRKSGGLSGVRLTSFNQSHLQRDHEPHRILLAS